MKVLHVVSSGIGDQVNGYTLRTERIVEAQRRAGIEAEVITPGQATIDELDLVIRAIARDLSWSVGQVVRELGAEIVTAADLLAALHRHRNDDVIVHAHTPWTCALAADLFCMWYGICGRFVFEARGLQEESAEANGLQWSEARRKAWKVLGTRARTTADAVCAISPGLLSDAIERGARRAVLTPNAVNCDLFRPLSAIERGEVRAKYNLGTGPIVGYFGSIRPLEGIDELLRALPRLREVVPGIRLVIAGAGEWPPMLVTASELGVSDVLDYRGSLPSDQIPPLLGAVDCVAITRPDTTVTRTVTPLKPLEALACGVPVVSSDLPALRFVGQQGTVFYEPGDIEQLVGALRTVLDAPGFRGELGRAGRAWVEAERTWDLLAVKYRALYEELIG